MEVRGLKQERDLTGGKFSIAEIEEDMGQCYDFVKSTFVE